MFPSLYALKLCTNKHMCKLATGQKKALISSLYSNCLKRVFQLAYLNGNLTWHKLKFSSVVSVTLQNNQLGAHATLTHLPRLMVTVTEKKT